MENKIKPLIPVNPEGLDDIAEGLLQNVAPVNNLHDFKPSLSSGIVSPEKYIILPGTTHENYSYSDSLVAMDRTYQGKDWTNCHKAVAQEGGCMLTIRQFIDFVNLLKTIMLNISITFFFMNHLNLL